MHGGPQTPVSVSPVGDAIVLCRNNDEHVWTAAMAAGDDPQSKSRYNDGLSDDVVAAARLLKLTAAPVDGVCHCPRADPQAITQLDVGRKARYGLRRRGPFPACAIIRVTKASVCPPPPSLPRRPPPPSFPAVEPPSHKSKRRPKDGSGHDPDRGSATHTSALRPLPPGSSLRSDRVCPAPVQVQYQAFPLDILHGLELELPLHTIGHLPRRKG